MKFFIEENMVYNRNAIFFNGYICNGKKFFAD